MNGYYIKNLGGQPRYSPVGLNKDGSLDQNMIKFTLSLINKAKPNLFKL